jgi:hypothetical protein
VSQVGRDPGSGAATVADVVREAAGAVDPTDHNALIGDFERWFEDDDDPAGTVPDLERRVAGAVDELDPDGAIPELAGAAATVLYLATRPRHEPRDQARLIEQAVRFQYRDDVPRAIADWLSGAG